MRTKTVERMKGAGMSFPIKEQFFCNGNRDYHPTPGFMPFSSVAGMSSCPQGVGGSCRNLVPGNKRQFHEIREPTLKKD